MMVQRNGFFQWRRPVDWSPQREELQCEAGTIRRRVRMDGTGSGIYIYGGIKSFMT